MPLVGEPPKHAREVSLDEMPAIFEWPEFDFFGFMEHTGEDREAQALESGKWACSVADRRCVIAPSERCYHFIGTVQQFVDMYPFPIRRMYSHVTCGWANWASWRTWLTKVRDGSMLAAAEELLWLMCLGDRSAGEQPPTAHQHTLGPPTFVTNGNNFGGPNKTYCWWLRNLCPVEPTDVVPEGEQWSELAVSGTPETKTVKRSYSPRNMATAFARAHCDCSGGDTSEFGRPANQPCRMYATWRRQLTCNFALFAAHFAPTISAQWLRDRGDDEQAIMLIPFTQSKWGPCALIPLGAGLAVFGDKRDATRTGASQGNELAALISDGVETMFASYASNEQRDAVVMVPWSQSPTFVAQSQAQREAATHAGLCAAWCTMAALDDHPAYVPAGLAFERAAALTQYGAHQSQQAGIWTSAKPLVRYRTARAWSQQEDLHPEEWFREREAFLDAEAARGTQLAACIAAMDDGDGDMIAIADNVRTAADYRNEIPFPLNGLPTFTDPVLRMLRFVERPLSLSTRWFARLPPQSVPPGFAPMPWTSILRDWARRACCSAINKTGDREFDILKHGETTMRRPRYVCIGPGGAYEIPHADGIGTYNAMSIVYERMEGTDLYDKLDYQKEGRTHWVLSLLERLLGTHDDRQLMALIMQGVRWMVNMPLQIRIAPNLERMDTRVQGVGHAFKKLIDKGLYYKYTKLRRANEKVEPDGPGPFNVLPLCSVGSGGTDKPDNPSESRIIGDQTSPHPAARRTGAKLAAWSSRRGTSREPQRHDGAHAGHGASGPAPRREQVPDARPRAQDAPPLRVPQCSHPELLLHARRYVPGGHEGRRAAYVLPIRDGAGRGAHVLLPGAHPVCRDRQRRQTGVRHRQ